MSKVLLFVPRFLFAGCIVVLAALAWLPADAMRRTALGGHAEHVVAYLGTMIVMGLAVRKGPSLPVQCAILGAWAAILEAGQVVTPGRHACFEDLAYSCLGIAAGGIIVWRGRPRVPVGLGRSP